MNPSATLSLIKQSVLNDLDGGRGSGMPLKRRTRMTYSTQAPSNSDVDEVTKQPPKSSQSSLVPAGQTRSAEYVSSTSTFLNSSLRSSRKAFHGSMDDFHHRTTRGGKNPREKVLSTPSKAQEPEEPALLLFSDNEDKDKPDDKDSSSDKSFKTASGSEREETDNETEDDNTSNDLNQGRTPPQDEGHSSEGQQDVRQDQVALLEENISLKNCLESQRRVGLKRKVITVLLFEALRAQKRSLFAKDGELLKKKQEVAARVILHNLLLNSWRLKSSELAVVMNDNSQLHKNIDNLCLQLRVVRHLQTTEKDKLTAKNKELDLVQTELAFLKKDHSKITRELEKVSGESNELKGSLETLRRSNNKACNELNALRDKKDALIRGSESDRIKAQNFQTENAKFKKDCEEMSEKLRETTKQSSHWQEKARSLESDCWELKLNMDTRARLIADLEKERDEFKKQNEIMALSKSKTEKGLKELQEKSETSLTDNDELKDQLEAYETQFQDMEIQYRTLNHSYNRLKLENKEIREQFYSHSLKNVRRRRVWGKALYYIFNPFGLLRSYFVDDYVPPIRRNIYRDNSNDNSTHNPTSNSANPSNGSRNNNNKSVGEGGQRALPSY